MPARGGHRVLLRPAFHPSFRYAAGPRKELGVRTVFNFLGPMANPARVRRQVLGVSDSSMADRMADVLAARRPPGAGGVWPRRARRAHDHRAVVGHRDARRRGPALRRGARAAGDRPGLPRGPPGRHRRGERRCRSPDPGRRARSQARCGGPQRRRWPGRAGKADDLALGVELARASIDDGHAAESLTRLVDVSNA